MSLYSQVLRERAKTALESARNEEAEAEAIEKKKEDSVIKNFSSAVAKLLKDRGVELKDVVPAGTPKERVLKPIPAVIQRKVKVTLANQRAKNLAKVRPDATSTGTSLANPKGADSLKKSSTIEKPTEPVDPLPFLEATKKGLELEVMELIEKGVDVESTDMKGSTALMLAADIGHGSIIRLLLSTGNANIDTLNPNNGRTALHYAVAKLRLGITETLIETWEAQIEIKERIFGYTPLHQAIYNNDMPTATYLLGRGADLEATDKDGLTCLGVAAEGGHMTIVQFLVNGGADIMAQSRKGKTAIDVARTEEIRNYLLTEKDNVQKKLSKLKEETGEVSDVEEEFF